jgi:hypothetical protein
MEQYELHENEDTAQCSCRGFGYGPFFQWFQQTNRHGQLGFYQSHEFRTYSIRTQAGSHSQLMWLVTQMLVRNDENRTIWLNLSTFDKLLTWPCVSFNLFEKLK